LTSSLVNVCTLFRNFPSFGRGGFRNSLRGAPIDRRTEPFARLEACA
jgi:hypothetical protein